MKLTIRKKLFLSFSLMILLTFILGITSIYSLDKIKDKAKQMDAVWTMGISLSKQISIDIADIRGKEYRYVLLSNKDSKASLEKDIQDNINNIEKDIKAYEETIVLNEDKKLLSELETQWAAYKNFNNEVMDLSNQGKAEEADRLMVGKGLDAYRSLTKACYNLSTFNDTQSDISVNGILSVFNKSTALIIVIFAFTLVLSMTIAYLLSTNISRRVNIVCRMLDKTANYNLVYDQNEMDKVNKFRSKDEMKMIIDRLANMRKELRSIVGTVISSSNGVESTSKDLSITITENSEMLEGVAKAIDDMAHGSVELAQSTQSSANKLEELSQEIDAINKTSNDMAGYIEDSKKAKDRGIEVVTKLQNAVLDNEAVTSRVGEKVFKLNEKSERITTITETIKNITSQINLLSINASIESARAGKAGRGFAVVANEIKKLASDTDSSTIEIENIISEFKRIIDDTKKEMLVAKDVIRNTSHMSNETSEVFSIIGKSVTNIIDKIDILGQQINSMNNNKEEVVKAIEEISAVSEESAATTEEISASVQEQSSNMEQISNSTDNLYKIVHELKELLGKFKI